MSYPPGQDPRQPGPYGQPDPYGPPGAGQSGPPTDPVAIVGLVLAVLAAPLGLVVSIVALFRTRGGERGGRGLAIAGVVVGAVFSLVAAAAIAALALVAVRVGEEVGSLPEALESFAEQLPTEPVLPSGFPTEGDLDLGAPGTVEVEPSEAVPVGTGVPIGDLSVTLTSVALDADEELAGADSPPPSGRYVLASAEVRNDGSDAASVYFEVNASYVTADGTAYDEFSCAASGYPGAPLGLAELPPGGSTEVAWCFDVPTDAVGDGYVVLTTFVDGTRAVWSDR